jgi:hypothetical protein
MVLHRIFLDLKQQIENKKNEYERIEIERVRNKKDNSLIKIFREGEVQTLKKKLEKLKQNYAPSDEIDDVEKQIRGIESAVEGGLERADKRRMSRPDGQKKSFWAKNGRNNAAKRKSTGNFLTV